MKHAVFTTFLNRSNSQEGVMTWFKEQAADFYDTGIQKLFPRLNKCLDNAGDYVEKWSYVQEILSHCRFCKLKMLYMFNIFVSLLFRTRLVQLNKLNKSIYLGPFMDI
jgi:hypothetical protein